MNVAGQWQKGPFLRLERGHEGLVPMDQGATRMRRMRSCQVVSLLLVIMGSVLRVHAAILYPKPPRLTNAECMGQ